MKREAFVERECMKLVSENGNLTVPAVRACPAATFVKQRVQSDSG